jgi:hypothetical protein
MAVIDRNPVAQFHSVPRSAVVVAGDTVKTRLAVPLLPPTVEPLNYHLEPVEPGTCPNHDTPKDTP